MSINQDLATTSLVKRQGLIVCLNSVSHQFKLRRFGDIVYFSKKMAYCILYVDQKDASKIIDTLNSFDFVKSVEKSDSEKVDLSSPHIEQQISDLAKAAERQLVEKQQNNTEQLL